MTARLEGHGALELHDVRQVSSNLPLFVAGSAAGPPVEHQAVAQRLEPYRVRLLRVIGRPHQYTARVSAGTDIELGLDQRFVRDLRTEPRAVPVQGTRAGDLLRVVDRLQPAEQVQPVRVPVAQRARQSESQ